MTPSDSQSQLPVAPRFVPAADVSALYAAHAGLVRRSLSRLGVEARDLDDLCQEVFLLLHDKREQLTEVAQLEAWLREVCRRVASGYRRRAYRQREIAVSSPAEGEGDATQLPEAQLEQSQDEERLHRALDALDDEARDLVALHELGNLPLSEVAELVERDRKTVSKKLEAALKKLGVLLRRTGSLAEPRPSSRSSYPPARESGGQPSAGTGFSVLAKSPSLNVGLVGAVVIAVWPGAVTVDALALLEAQFVRVAEQLPAGFAYLAVVEGTTRPPPLEARQKIVSIMRAHTADVRLYATALLGGAAWIAKPIMTGMAKLARAPIALHFFNGIRPAAEWLASSDTLPTRADAVTIAACAELLRRS